MEGATSSSAAQVDTSGSRRQVGLTSRRVVAGRAESPKVATSQFSLRVKDGRKERALTKASVLDDLKDGRQRSALARPAWEKGSICELTGLVVDWERRI